MQEAVMDKPVVDQTGLTDRYDFQCYRLLEVSHGVSR
jgi:hypothetical protein